MIKVENIRVFNLLGAFRGARNPLESWDLSDSFYLDGEEIIGKNDLSLGLKLIKAGPDHSKYMRQIFVCMDITSSISWWWDFDTYKVSTVKNSTSRMHKLGTRLLTAKDFSFDNEYGDISITPFRQYVMDDLNRRISEYQKLKKTDLRAAKALWREIILDLPQSYNFLATWTGNYENLRNIYHNRKDHKQREFREFRKEIEGLPYGELITVARGRK
jgi:hypothetical protein